MTVSKTRPTMSSMIGPKLRFAGVAVAALASVGIAMVVARGEEPSEYQLLRYSRDPLGNGQLEFHFAGDAALVAADSVEHAVERASTGAASSARQDPGGAVMICGNVHSGVGPNVSLFFPADWSVSTPRSDSDFLSIDEGREAYETDLVFGKIIDCPPSAGVTQVYIALADALTDVRVVASGGVIRVTAVG